MTTTRIDSDTRYAYLSSLIAAEIPRHARHPSIVLLVIALFTMLALGSALAQQDVGVVTQLQGAVEFRSDAANSGRVTPFMKIRSGDHFKVAPGTEIKLVYFSGARVELWRGPAAFITGTSQSAGISGEANVSKLPNAAPPSADLGRLLVLSRVGSVTVRGSTLSITAVDADIALATKTSDHWRTAAEPEDVLPDLYLYAVLKQHNRLAEMKSLADSLMRKFPASQEVQQLAVEAGSAQYK